MSAPRDEDRDEADGADRDDDAPTSGDRASDGGVGDAPMRASLMSVFFCGLIFGVVGFALGGLRTGFGVTLGGLIATANLWVFAKVAQAFVARKGNTAPWGIIALLKMSVLFGGVWLILRTDVISALSLIAGYLALPIGIAVGSLFGPRPPEEPGGQNPPPRGRDVIKGARTRRKGGT